MKVIITIMILLLNMSIEAKNTKIDICYIPLNNLYYKNIGIESIMSHRDVKCQIIGDKRTYIKIITILSTLKINEDTTITTYSQDFRVSISMELNKESKVVYISRWGYILYGNQLYNPNKELLQLIGKRIDQSW